MFWTKYSYERNRRNALEISNLVMRGIGVMLLINYERNRCNVVEMLPLDDRL